MPIKVSSIYKYRLVACSLDFVVVVKPLFWGIFTIVYHSFLFTHCIHNETISIVTYEEWYDMVVIKLKPQFYELWNHD